MGRADRGPDRLRARPLAVAVLVVLSSLGTTTALLPHHANPELVPSPTGLPEVRSHPAVIAAGGAVAELRVDVADPAIVPYTGVETNLTAYTPPSMPANSQLQISADVVLGQFDAVFGIFLNNTIEPVPFFEVFSNTTDQALRLVYWPHYALNPSSGYLFALTRTQGTVWEFTLDGVPFDNQSGVASYDFGQSAGNWTRSVSLSEVVAYGGTAFSPPPLTASLAFAVLRSTGWYLPENATASSSGSLAGPWGIEGARQHPTLAPGEVVSGPSIAPLANGTVLWSGGPIPVLVTLVVGGGATPVVAATGILPVLVAVSSTGGIPIPEVAVDFRDTFGGQFYPSSLVTGPTGNASGNFIAPNASVRETDDLRANVTIFGYLGSATVPVVVTASVEVRLLAPAAVRVLTSGSLDVRLRAVDSNGTPLAGVFVAFAVSGSAGISPTAGVTDSAGWIDTTVLAPGAATSVTLIATVDSAGYWGATRVSVDVVAPSDSWLLGLIPYFVLGAVAAVAFVAVLLARRRAAQEQRDLPPLGRLKPPAPPPAAPRPPAQP